MVRTTGTALANPPALRRDDVVRSILDLVEERGLKPGDKLPPIREMAAALGLKPTVVRDALLQARAMGQVRILARAGAFLQPPAEAPQADELAGKLETALARDSQNMFHLLDARRLIEIELAGRAAERRRIEELLPVRQALEAMANIPEEERRGDYVEQDIRFHVEIARLAGNAVLQTVQQTLLGLLRPHLLELSWTAERQHRTDRSHAILYAALVAGDVARIRAEMCEHLSMAYNSLLHDVQTTPAVNRAHSQERP
jgi:GntR family transcriptional regulator, transcriptional repressor for pyruvate dehydrogenase complex